MQGICLNDSWLDLLVDCELMGLVPMGIVIYCHAWNLRTSPLNDSIFLLLSLHLHEMEGGRIYFPSIVFSCWQFF